MEVNTTPTNIVYKVDDRTGPWVKVQKWVSDQDPSERMTCQEGMYVRVVGHLKVFNKQRSVTAFYVKPVTDYNQISHHLSEVMFAHLTSTKGAPVVKELCSACCLYYELKSKGTPSMIHCNGVCYLGCVTSTVGLMLTSWAFRCITSPSKLSTFPVSRGQPLRVPRV